MEAGLRALRATSLAWREKLGVLVLISGYVRTETLLSQDMASSRAHVALGKAEAEQRYGRQPGHADRSGSLPRDRRLLASRVFEHVPRRESNDPKQDPDFTFGLERILDGVSAAIDRTSAQG